jgi:small subunit ribosomal protein S13
MAEEKAKQYKKIKEKTEKPKQEEIKIKAISLVRILSTDIPGNLSVYAGLTKIKGVSWMLSNAICTVLNMDKNKKMTSLSQDELDKLSAFTKNPKVPEWLFNRKKDRESGSSKHLITAELDLAKDFDIRRMKKIKSYKGWRHTMGQPVRGQRPRSHFRKGSAIGVAKGKARQAPKPTTKKEEKEKKK